MKARNKIQQIAAKSFPFSLVLFGFGINLPDFLIPWFADLVILCWLADIIINRKWNRHVRNRDNYALFFLILFMAWSGISFLYTQNIPIGYKHFETRLMILVFPLILLFHGEPESSVNTRVLKAFIFGNLFSIAWVVAIIFNGLNENPLNRVNFHNYPVDQVQYYIGLFRHRSYFDLNLIAGMIILYRFVAKNNITQLLYFIFYSLIIVSIIFISGARMPLIIACIVVVFIILRFFFGRPKSLIATAVFIILVALWIPLSQTGKDSSTIKNVQRESEIRRELWQNSWQLIKQKPFSGYGLGDANDVLNSGKDYPQEPGGGLISYNSHNQYLDILLECGIPGLLLFLISIIYLFLTARKSRYSGEAMLLLIFLISLTVESMLNRVAGVGLFVFNVLIIRKHALYFNDTRHDLSARNLVPVSLLILAIMVAGTSATYLFGKKFDPLDPSTFASRVHRVVPYEKLPGKLPDEIPAGAGGYYMDSTCNASVWDGNAYSYTLFREMTANKRTHTEASVYCYVSDNFSGSNPKISCECNAEKKVVYDSYDLRQKGTWQKLTIEPACRKGKKQFYLYFEMQEATDFSAMRGYIIFVSPEIIKTENERLSDKE